MKRINFETAKLLHQVDATFLNEVGYFDEKEKLDYACPYQAELQEWLRKHNIHIQPTYTSFYDGEYKNHVGYRLNIIIGNTEKRPAYNYILEDEELNLKYNGGILQGEGIVFDTYEDALETGLVEGLKIVIDANNTSISNSNKM